MLDTVMPDTELDLFYNQRGWFWTKTGKGMGIQGPFSTATKAVTSAEWIHPDLKWVAEALEFYKEYL